MSTFLESLASLAEQQHQHPKLDPEVQIMRLQEAAKRYWEADRGPRFAAGDLVTPIKDGPVKGHGEPQLVVAARKDAEPDFRSSRLHGERNDIRIITLTEGIIFPHWGESAHYESWGTAKEKNS